MTTGENKPPHTDPARPTRTYDEHVRLDRAVVRATSTRRQPSAPREIVQAYRERGRFKINLSIARSGLHDLLLAHAHALGRGSPISTFEDLLEDLLNRPHVETTENEDVTLLAYLGEALRIYARDVQLSVLEEEGDVERTVEKSIECFGRSLEKLGAGTDEITAWIYAHQAAARMMIYWLRLVSNDTTEQAVEERAQLFKECETGFKDALAKRQGSYPWCSQFLSFLYALRGESTDFRHASELLEDIVDKPAGDGETRKVSGLSETRRVALLRSIAMLSSYDAVASSLSVTEQLSAARNSVDSGLNAMAQDPDEFMAAYSVAVSRWVLHEREAVEDPTDKALHRANLSAALDVAEARSRNAISQALATLVGLAFVRMKMARGAERDRLADHAEALQNQFYSFMPDLETRAMFLRDPAWQAILKDGDCRERFKDKPLAVYSSDRPPPRRFRSIGAEQPGSSTRSQFRRLSPCSWKA
jgi:hypothetical protein